MSNYALVKVQKHFRDGKPTCENEGRCPFSDECDFVIYADGTYKPGKSCPVHASEPDRLLREAIELLGDVYCEGASAVRREQALAKLREVGE